MSRKNEKVQESVKQSEGRIERQGEKAAGNMEADQVLLERLDVITSQSRSSELLGIFSKRDYIQAVLITVICLCAVVAGAFL